MQEKDLGIMLTYLEHKIDLNPKSIKTILNEFYVEFTEATEGINIFNPENSPLQSHSGLAALSTISMESLLHKEKSEIAKIKTTLEHALAKKNALRFLARAGVALIFSETPLETGQKCRLLIETFIVAYFNIRGFNISSEGIVYAIGLMKSVFEDSHTDTMTRAKQIKELVKAAYVYIKPEIPIPMPEA